MRRRNISKQLAMEKRKQAGYRTPKIFLEEYERELQTVADLLLEKQKTFAEKFVLITNQEEDLDKRQRAIKAVQQSGYPINGDEIAATEIAIKMLSNPNVVKYINKLDSTVLKSAKKITNLSLDYVQSIILEAISRGLPRNEAAGLANVSPNVLSDWLKEGEEGKGRQQIIFYTKFKEAEAFFHQTALNVVYQAATGIRRKKKIKTEYALVPVKKGDLDENVKGKEALLKEVVLSKEVTEEEIPPDWYAAAWLLERKFGEVWSLKKGEKEKDPREIAREIQLAIIEINNSIPNEAIECSNTKAIEYKDDPDIIDIKPEKEKEKVTTKLDTGA